MSSSPIRVTGRCQVDRLFGMGPIATGEEGEASDAGMTRRRRMGLAGVCRGRHRKDPARPEPGYDEPERGVFDDGGNQLE
jgi:hypothetical protein